MTDIILRNATDIILPNATYILQIGMSILPIVMCFRFLKQELKWAWEKILPIAKQVLYWAWEQIKILFVFFFVSLEVRYVDKSLQAINSNLKKADVDAMGLTADEEEFDSWESELRDLAFKAKVVIEIFKCATPCDGCGYFQWIIGFFCQIPTFCRLKNEIDDFKRRYAELPAEMPKFKERSREDGETSITLREKGGDRSVTEQNDIVGFDKEDAQLWLWLTGKKLPEQKELPGQKETPGQKKPPGQHVIVSIWGTGGAGKTSLAHKIYKRGSVTKEFNYVRWVSVSQRYDVKQIGNLIEEEQSQTVDINDVRQKVHQSEKGDCLIILDDVWKKEDFVELTNAIPKSPEKRILVTSRTEEVGALGGHLLHLETMEKEGAMKLFLKKVYQYDRGEEDKVSPEQKHYAREILKFCEGLPMAIVILGDMLQSKRHTIQGWKDLSESMYSALVFSRKIEDIQKVIRLSYIELPCRFRSCFLYLGLFPKDSMIDCDKLIRLWLAEGFLEQQGDNDDSRMEYVAKQCLDGLIQRSLIQVKERELNGKPRKCSTQNLIRDFAIQEAKKTKFSSISKKQPLEWVEVIHRIALNLKESEVLGTSTALPRDSQSLSHLVSSSFEYLSKFFRYPNNVHSFLHFSKASPQFGFQQFPLLRVLDLEGAEQMEEVPNEIRKLNLLRYLSLRGTRVERIPNWIANLRNLQTLDTPTSKIPIGALKLHQLRYLFADSFYDPSSSTPCLRNNIFSKKKSLCIDIGVLKHLHILELDITGCTIIGLDTLTNLKVRQVRDGERILLRAM